MGLANLHPAATEQRRHPRHTHPPIHIGLDGRSYTTVDWSAGGFLIAAYDGPCRPGDHALVDVVVPAKGRTARFTAEVVIARICRDDRQLAARFTRLARNAVDSLAALAAESRESGAEMR